MVRAAGRAGAGRRQLWAWVRLCRAGAAGPRRAGAVDLRQAGAAVGLQQPVAAAGRSQNGSAADLQQIGAVAGSVRALRGALARACLLLVVAGGLPGAAFAQNERAGGLAAEATYKWTLPRAWSVSVGPGLEARPYYASTDPEATAPPTLRNLDLNAAVARRWLEHWRFGTAVRLRSRYPFGGDGDGGERARELRTWLYAEFITDSRYFRWAHRFRTEQRFRGDAGEPLALTYRHRYRVGFEHALAGQTVDPEEWFVTASAEVLLSTDRFAARPTAIDVRPTVTFGKGSYEFGLEFRGEHTVPAANSRESHVLLAVLQVSL